MGRREDVEEGGANDAGLDAPDSFLLCVSENWDKLKKQLTVGLVVSWCNVLGLFSCVCPSLGCSSALGSDLVRKKV